LKRKSCVTCRQWAEARAHKINQSRHHQTVLNSRDIAYKEVHHERAKRANRNQAPKHRIEVTPRAVRISQSKTQAGQIHPHSENRRQDKGMRVVL
jgi:hypothetical protein